jgi:hypothetical protein
VLASGQAQAVADLAHKVADRYERPQDIEWAIDQKGRLWLLQARPMTALPELVSWTAPGPGLWMRNFRLGEWLPEAVTPSFATWLLPMLEDGYLDGMHKSVGVRVPFRYALVNGWYYNAAPTPSPKLLLRVLWQGRGRAVKIIYNALIRVSRDPAAADRAVLSDPPARLPAARHRSADRGHNGYPRPVGAAGRPARARSRNLPVVPGDRRRVSMEDGGLPDTLLPAAPGPCAV